MTMKELQLHFALLYGRRASYIHGDLAHRISFLGIAVGDLQEGFRKGITHEGLEVALARCVSRIFSIVEHFRDMPFVELFSQKYPAQHCGYCKQLPCACAERRPAFTPSTQPWPAQLNWSLTDWCQHFERMYGERNRARGVDNLLLRLFKEVAEVLAIWMQVTRNTTNVRSVEHVVRNFSLDEVEREIAFEIADTLAWTIAVANAAGVDLEAAVMRRFGDGCSTCHHFPCDCTYTSFAPRRWSSYLVSSG